MIPRLGINIDHIATLREARDEGYPSVVQAATACLEEGADQITIHLREDRRHIQDTDVEAVHLVTKRYGKPLNFEIGCNPEIIDIAIATSPDWICLVPEKREERTTEGGLNLLDETQFLRVKEVCEKLKSSLLEVKISLFLESNEKILEKACLLPIDAVEIHTGDYARAFLNDEEFDHYLTSFKSSYDFLSSHQIGFHAGHGLTNESLKPLLEMKLFVEYNIGHWVICDSVFNGLAKTVSGLNKLFKEFPL